MPVEPGWSRSLKITGGVLLATELMFVRIINQIREKIRARQYVMTLHGEEEMDDDGLTIFDVENGLLTGKIIEQQKDRYTGEWKYIVRGETIAGDKVISKKIFTN